MMCQRICFLLLLWIGVAVSGEGTVGDGLDLRSPSLSPCHESFPLAASSSSLAKTQIQNNNSNNININHRRLPLVTIPTDTTRRAYAPLCPDGQHIDIRRLEQCPEDQCWAERYQNCMHVSSSYCKVELETRTGEEEEEEGNEQSNYEQSNYEQSNENETEIVVGEGARANDGKCQPGQCFVEMYQLCISASSQECRNSPPTKQPTGRPSPSPTPLPTFAMETTVHPVKLTLENVPKGYELTVDVRALIIRFATETIENWLDPPMELVEVKFGGNLSRRTLERLRRHSRGDPLLPFKRGGSGVQRRRLDEVPVPLEVTLSGPSNMSDFALSFVMEILQERLQDLIGTLKSYDKETFKDVGVASSTYKESDIVVTAEPTQRPTGKPTTAPISGMPTDLPTLDPTTRGEETVHPVALTFKNVPNGYSLLPEVRAAVMRFVKDRLEEDLEESLELVEVTYPGILVRYEGQRNQEFVTYGHQRSLTQNNMRRRLAEHSLPLLVRVKGPADLSDFALVYVMEAFSVDMLRDLCLLMRTLDSDTFGSGCGITVETYNLNDIGQTAEPTRRPTEKPTQGPIPQDVVTTDHPVQLTFGRVPVEYTLSVEARSSLILFIKEMLEAGLNRQLELISVTYAGTLLQSGASGSRLLQQSSGLYHPQLALMIRVRAPADISDFALAYIMQVFRDNMDDLEDFLASLDNRAFENAKIAVGMYDMEEIADATELEETFNPVQLIFNSLPAGYVLSPEEIESVVEFMNDMLGGILQDPYVLIDTSYPGQLDQSDPPSLPLIIRLEGPSDISNLALSYITQVVGDHMQAIESYLNSLDDEVFENPRLSVDSYDLDDISDTTMAPTPAPRPMENAVHPIQIIFDSAPPGYAFTPEVRADLVRYVNMLLEENLGDPFEFLKASDAGMLRRARTRLLQSGAPSLPLLVSVKEPSDESALPAILDVFDENMEDLEDFLESKDDVVFEGPEVRVEPYDGEPEIDPYVVTEDEPETPWWEIWWIWFLVTLGILSLLCCLCLCCSYYHRYHYLNKKDKDMKNEQQIITIERPEDRVIERPIVVEKPVIIEKPVFIEKEAKERHRKVKKHHKKKKKKKHHIKKPQVMQVEEDQSAFDGPILSCADMSVRSGLTFDYDPPSEHYLQIQGDNPYHAGRFLASTGAPTTVASMSVAPRGLTNGTEEHIQILCADPTADHNGFSVGQDPSQHELLALAYGDGREDQSYYSKKSKLRIWDGTGSQSYAARDPQGLTTASQSQYTKGSQSQYTKGSQSQYTKASKSQYSKASRSQYTKASQSQYTKDTSRHSRVKPSRSNHVSNASQSQYGYAIEPAGSGWEASQASYAKEPSVYSRKHQDDPSFATQAPRLEPRGAASAMSGHTSIFASFDDPSFRRGERLQLGGVESDGESYDVWNSQRGGSLR